MKSLLLPLLVSAFLLGCISTWTLLRARLTVMRRTRTRTKTIMSVLSDEATTCPQCGAPVAPHVEHACEVDE